MGHGVAMWHRRMLDTLYRTDRRRSLRDEQREQHCHDRRG